MGLIGVLAFIACEMRVYQDSISTNRVHTSGPRPWVVLIYSTHTALSRQGNDELMRVFSGRHPVSMAA